MKLLINPNTRRGAHDCLVSIIIKAFNEENNIANAVGSALSAVAGWDAEVIVVDCLSTDKTAQIALGFPVTVVQLFDAGERSCGIAPQLGFQICRGEYIYLMDGDMELRADFIRKALHYLENHANVAGVGGMVEEVNAANLIFLARKYNPPSHMRPGIVDRLNMGGLYRRDALVSVGYFSNRNLHSFEELELALRLRAKNWLLVRIPSVSVLHYGHTLPEYKLLIRRFCTRYARGPGELLRSALGKPYFYRAAREFKVFLAVVFFWLSLGLSVAFLPAPVTYLLLAAALLAALFAVLKKGIKCGIYAIAAWHVFGLATLLGFIRKQRGPEEAISHKILLSPAAIRSPGTRAESDA